MKANLAWCQRVSVTLQQQCICKIWNYTLFEPVLHARETSKTIYFWLCCCEIGKCHGTLCNFIVAAVQPAYSKTSSELRISKKCSAIFSCWFMFTLHIPHVAWLLMAHWDFFARLRCNKRSAQEQKKIRWYKASIERSKAREKKKPWKTWYQKSS